MTKSQKEEVDEKYCYTCQEKTLVYVKDNICTECLMNPDTEWKETKNRKKVS